MCHCPQQIEKAGIFPLALLFPAESEIQVKGLPILQSVRNPVHIVYAKVQVVSAKIAVIPTA